MSRSAISALRALACGVVFVLGGCASRATPTMHESMSSAPAVTGCAMRFDPQSALAISADPLQPTRLRIDAQSACEGVALFRLPRFREGWTLDLASAFDGEQLYAPRAELLDEQGRVRRELSFNRFALRGDRLQATLFFEAGATTERYLRVLPAREVLGQGGRRVVSGSFAIPLLNTVMPLVYLQGTESERRYAYTDAGVLHLAARDARSPRRHPQAHDLARGELSMFAR